MNRNGLLSTVLFSATVVTFGQAMGGAQTAWVHINHRVTGNSIITPVDLITAPKADLMRLPGIGEADAQKIIDRRPYRDDERTAGQEHYFGGDL